MEKQTPTIVNCGHGAFRGFEQNGIRTFRGITFGLYERLKEATEVIPSGEIDATEYGAVCPQRSSRLDSILGEEKGAKMEEGRLCLSIYSPAEASNLPVMVWIHGGAFLTGGSEEHRYSGERLVAAGNVVVVKISYRLGAFGYLHLPERGAVNLGLSDQKLALRWIAHNIESFGGDPANVTIFSQSAGAQSAAALIATAGPEPGFAKAILQSPPLGLTMPERKAKSIARKFLKKLHKDPTEATIDEILDVQGRMTNVSTGLNFMPVIPDYAAIPQSIVDNKIDIVVGTTKDDISPFLRKTLGPLLGTIFGKVIIKAMTDHVFTDPVIAYVEKLRAAGILASRYTISWAPKGNPLGSCHCIEMPFILGDIDDWSGAGMLKGMTDEEYETNSKDLLHAWTTFAWTGKMPEVGILKIK